MSDNMPGRISAFYQAAEKAGKEAQKLEFELTELSQLVAKSTRAEGSEDNRLERLAMPDGLAAAEQAVQSQYGSLVAKYLGSEETAANLSPEKVNQLGSIILGTTPTEIMDAVKAAGSSFGPKSLLSYKPIAEGVKTLEAKVINAPVNEAAQALDAHETFEYLGLAQYGVTEQQLVGKPEIMGTLLMGYKAEGVVTPKLLEDQGLLKRDAA